MGATHFLPNQLCNHMINFLVRCQHSSFQTHHCNICIEKDIMLLSLDMSYRKCINQECIPFLCHTHECLCSHKRLRKLGFLCKGGFLKFDMCSTSPDSSLSTWRIGSYISPAMLMIMVSQSEGSYLDVLKWRILICQSTSVLYKMNQNSPMMIGFFKDMSFFPKKNFLIQMNFGTISFVICYNKCL